MISKKQIFCTVCRWALVFLKIFVLSFYTDFIEIIVGWFEYIELMIQKAQHSYADILAFAARDSIAIVSRLALVSLYGISFANIYTSTCLNALCRLEGLAVMFLRSRSFYLWYNLLSSSGLCNVNNYILYSIYAWWMARLEEVKWKIRFKTRKFSCGLFESCRWN